MSNTYQGAGFVEERSSKLRVSGAGEERGKWHYTCLVCGKRLRMPAYQDMVFDCKACNQEYRVFVDGSVYASTVQVGIALAEPEQAIPSPVEPAPAPQVRQHLPATSQVIYQAKPSLLQRAMATVADAAEQAHGKRLRDGLVSTREKLLTLDRELAKRAILGFIEKREQLQREMGNWSKDGCIKVGRTLQDEARKTYDFNLSGSYALWMAGAWLESSQRASDDAEFVHMTLDHFAESFL